jgi:hypothetical protein
MKRKVVLVLIGLAILIALYFGGPTLARYYYIKDNERYIEKVASIKFPPNTSVVQMAEMDWALLSKFTLDRDKIPLFKQSCPFPILQKNEKQVVSSFMLLDSVNRPPIDDLTKYDYLSDCKGKNTWQILLNNTTGELWIIVEFPDMSGDAPPCSK